MNLPACCLDLDIKLEHLLFPERMGADGWEFYQAHGLDRITLSELQARSIDQGEGMVKIRHRCAQLRDDGLCGIYETRPVVCREFDCTKRHDCACMGQGFIAVGDLVFQQTGIS